MRIYVDANKLLEKWNKLSERGRTEFDQVIMNEPTAYDVDKVVEQLEKRSKEYNSGIRLHGKPEEMLTNEVIEIVRGGEAS